MTDIDSLLTGHLARLPVPESPPLAMLIRRARRRSRRRASAVGLALFALTLGGVLGGLAVHRSTAGGGEQVLAGPGGSAGPVAPVPALRACTAPVGSAVPDCPVTPDSPEPYGHLKALPPGFALSSEIREALPTGNERRVDVITRRYRGPDSAMFLVTTIFGDLDSPAPEAVLGVQPTRDLTGLRVGTVVHEVPPFFPEGLTSYSYDAAPRIQVQVAFPASALTRQQRLDLVAGIS